MVNRYKLDNNLRLTTVPLTGTKTITVLVMVGTGSRYETKENSGISHFLEHMFFKGAKKYPTTMDISSSLDGIGAEFNAFTGKEYTGYWVKSDSTKIDVALDVVSDMLLNSKMETEEIEREKGVIVEELNMYEDNPMMHVEDVFEQCLYGDTPAGWDTIGTKENIMGFTRDDFINYLEEQYGSGNVNIFLVGNIKKDDYENKELVAKYFSSEGFDARGESFKEKERVVEAQEQPKVLVKPKETDQSHISLGVRTFGYGSKKKIFIKMMSIILGGSFSSRLFINLRERNGLAYYVRTNSEVYSDSGYLTTQAGVSSKDLEKSIKIILGEYKKLKEELVGEEELQRAKDMLQGKMTIQLESSDSLANWYGRQAVMGDTVKREAGKEEPIQTPEEYIEEIRKITPEDIKKYANEIFLENNLNLAVIGTAKGDDLQKLLLL